MTRSRLWGLAKLLFAGGLLYWVLDQVGWTTIRDTLSNIDLRRWSVGLAIVFAAHFVSMLRWHLLMKSVGLNTTPWIAIRLGFIGVFFNNVVPGLTGGDLVKAIYVTRENPRQRAGAVVSVIVDRVIGIVALALIAAVVIPFDMGTYGEAAVGTYGFLVLAAIGAVVALSRRAKAFLRGLLGRLRRDSGTGPSILGKIDQAVSIYRDRLQVLVWAMLLSVFVHLLIIVAIQVFGTALADGVLESLARPESAASAGDAAAQATRTGELERLRGLAFQDYCSMVPIIMIISALPIGPGGIGVGEAAFAHFFRAASVAEADAVALSLTYRITLMLVSLCGGVLLLFDRKRVMEAAAEDPPGAGSIPPPETPA